MLKKLIGQLERTSIGRRAVQDGRFRVVLITCAVLGINLAYAIYNGIIGFVYTSFWFISLFIYYSILSVMRFYAVTFEFRDGGKRTEYSVMRFCGALLCFLAIVLSGMVCLSITSERDASRHQIIMIAIAAYTFWKAITAVINIIKASKKIAPLLITLRNISCADAAVSILTLQHSMLSTFGDGFNRTAAIMDAATGAGAFAVILIMGICMLAAKKPAQEQ